MAFNTPEGMKIYFSSTFAAAKILSAVSNAAPPVGNSVAHGFVANDELLLSSNWEGITDTVVRATAPTADTVGLTGLDTTNVNFFAPGGGAGTTARKVSAWTEIPQVKDYNPSGGDPRFNTVKLLARRNANTFPTGGFDPVKVELKLVYDQSQPNYQALLAVSRNLTLVAYKQVLANGSSTYGYGYLVVKETPVVDDNTLVVTATFSALGQNISY